MNNSDIINNPILKDTALEVFQKEIAGGDIANFLQTILPNIIGLLFVVGSVIFFFILIWGALSWILSGGDKAHVESAKARITSALTGLIIMFATFAIIKFIEAFFGVNILSIDIGPLVIQ